MRSLIRAFAGRLNSLWNRLLTEHNLGYLRLKGGCTGSSESTIIKEINCRSSNALTGLVARKPVFGVLRITKAQTSLCIRAADRHFVYSLTRRTYNLACYEQNFTILICLCRRGDWFETRFVGHPEDRFHTTWPIYSRGKCVQT